MWKNDVPYIIDWEAAGYINPYEELIQVLNYWIVDEIRIVIRKSLMH